MSNVLTDQDRSFLSRACELARDARHPPAKLGLKVEPVWTALLAQGDRQIGAESFCPGDSTDAVRRLADRFGGPKSPETTLYLTLEPKAGFDRLPPVTESVRHLGVSRVVVGSLDPAQRYRGEGKSTLERMGVQVVLADGEEARLAQQLLEDYSKWLTKGLAVLRARVELQGVPDGMFDLKITDESPYVFKRADAVLCPAGKKVERGLSWLVVLDPENWESSPSDKTILYQGSPSVPGARQLPFRDGAPDLGALLRDLASLGILSVELSGDASLFRRALGSGLIESVVAGFPEVGDGARALAHVDHVRLAEGGDPLDLRLGGARVLDDKSLFLEARVELFQ